MLNLIKKDLNLCKLTELSNIVNNFDELTWKFERLNIFEANISFNRLLHNIYIPEENCVDIFKLNDKIVIVKCEYYSLYYREKMFELLVFFDAKLNCLFSRSC